MQEKDRILKKPNFIGEDTIRWYENFVLPRESNPALNELVQSSWDYFDRGGKRLRPSLLVLTCEALGGNYNSALPAAAALESVHNAFLIHDDIEDGSSTRRGKSALHKIKIYGVATAINTGDYLLFKTYKCLTVGRDGWDSCPGWGYEKYSRITDLMVELSEKTGEGQGMEIWLRKQPLRKATIERIYKILEFKTGYYTGGIPMTMGSVIANKEEKTDQMKKIGIDIGVGFQITDDVLNATMKRKDSAIAPTTSGGGIGKDYFGDADEGKRTLLVAYVMENGFNKEIKKLEKFWGRKKPKLSFRTKEQLQELFENTGAIDYCKNAAMKKLRYVDKRIKEEIPSNEKREALRDILKFYVERTF